MADINISNYKMNLIRDIIASETIIKGIDSRQQDIDTADDLIYKNIFPYLHIDLTQTIADCYITLAVDLLNVNRYNPTFVDLRLTVWVLCHIERQKMSDKNATRIDYVGEELRKMLDGSQKYGYGVLELVASREVILNENYQYRELDFRTVDMKTSAGKKVGSFR